MFGARLPKSAAEPEAPTQITVLLNSPSSSTMTSSTSCAACSNFFMRRYRFANVVRQAPESGRDVVASACPTRK